MATTVQVKFSYDIFKREVAEVCFYDIPDRFADGSIKDVGVLVTFTDGTQREFYCTMSARRPTGARSPHAIEDNAPNP